MIIISFNRRPVLSDVPEYTAEYSGSCSISGYMHCIIAVILCLFNLLTGLCPYGLALLLFYMSTHTRTHTHFRVHVYILMYAYTYTFRYFHVFLWLRHNL